MAIIIRKCSISGTAHYYDESTKKPVGGVLRCEACKNGTYGVDRHTDGRIMCINCRNPIDNSENAKLARLKKVGLVSADCDSIGSAIAQIEKLPESTDE